MKILWEILSSLAQGFTVTGKHLFRKPATELYPEEKRILPERSRGRIILTRDPDGAERCVACFLCSAACPVDCISMQAAEDNEHRRYAAWFRINFARCIYCGLCEQACPTSAIQLTPEFDHIRKDILSLVYEKEDLLVDHSGRDPAYNFYRYAGITTKAAGKGEHNRESPPVNIKTNLP